MRVLLDHNVDRRLRDHMPGREFVTSESLGWEGLANGSLIRAAADLGFDALLANDKKMEYEHNLLKLPVPIVLLDAPSITLADVMPFAPAVVRLLGSPMMAAFYVINPDKTTTRLTAPRPKRSPGPRPDAAP